MVLDSLQELADNLVQLRAPLTLEDPTAEALLTSVSIPDGYVWPNIENWDSPAGARVLLVEAAGAVGKSAAASALAATLNWPLIDTARAQVGSYSLSGLLQDGLGFNSPYIGEVMEGRAGLVIDALDEAHLRAGTANFLAFLDNVRKISGKSSERSLSIVLFSRPDTAAIVRLFFQDLNCPIASARVSFFTHDQAVDYIRSFMDRMHRQFPDRDYDAAEKYPEPFISLTNDRMREIASTLLTEDVSSAKFVWPRVSEFLGYAPVLAVLGEFLAVKNPHRERQAIGSTAAAPKSVLLKIIGNLLDREQEKFRGRTVSKLKALLSADESWDGFEGVYSPQEQGVRLVSYLLHSEIVVPMPANMPGSLREAYEKHAVQFLADHPFLAGQKAVNVVFSDFIMAKAAIDPACIASLNPDPRPLVDSVGPFFYQFVHEFASTSEDEGSQIPESLVAILLESQSKSSSSAKGQLFQYLQGGGDAYLELTDTMSRAKKPLKFSVTELSGALHVPERLSRGLLVTDSGVIVGNRGQRFILGPSAAIVAKEVVLDAEIVSVDAGLGGSVPSMLDSEEIAASGPLSIECPAQNAFLVYCNEPLAALRPYLANQGQRSSFIHHNDYMNLRAVLRSFRQQAGEAPSVFSELLEQRIIKNNAVRLTYLKRLEELGFVYRRSSHYYLDVKRLSSHGFTIRDMDSGQPTGAVLKFIALLDGK
ncbi:hypothetical protein [Micromonospora wenchangensis]|uniref:hypothetical protein n=1 Tax=Micromonospora wenchangensis TaxID=1185415 RepID=UPI0034475CDA